MKTPVGTGATPGVGGGTAAAGAYEKVKKLLVTVAQPQHKQKETTTNDSCTDDKIQIKRLIKNSYFYPRCKRDSDLDMLRSFDFNFYT